MGYQVSVGVIYKDYSDITTSNNIQKIKNSFNNNLAKLGLYVKNWITEEQYNKIEMPNKFKNIPRYIRIRKPRMENSEITEELKQVGESSFISDLFTGMQYGYIALSQYGETNYKGEFDSDNTNIGKPATIYNIFLSPRLEFIFGNYKQIPFYMAEDLSRSLQAPIVSMYTTSLNRYTDATMTFIDGQIRNEASGKTVLTNIKNDYGIDINNVMSSIDYHLQIKYAPSELSDIESQIKELKAGEEYLRSIIINSSTKKDIKQNKIELRSIISKLDQLQLISKTYKDILYKDPNITLCYFELGHNKKSINM